MTATASVGAEAGTGASAGTGVPASVAALAPSQRAAANRSIGNEVEQKLQPQLTAQLASSGMSAQQILSLGGALKTSIRASIAKSLGVQGPVGPGGGTAPAGSKGLAIAVGTKPGAGAGSTPTGALSSGAGLRFSIGFELKAALGGLIEAGLLGAGVQAAERRQIRADIEPAAGEALDSSLGSAFGPDPGYPHAAGNLILGATVTLQYEGAWFADLELDIPSDQDPPTGPLAFTIEDVEFRGTVQPARSGEWGGRTNARVVGGAGGLSTDLEARNYAGGVIRVRTVVADILRDSGETLSSESDQQLLDTQIDGWHRAQGAGHAALTQLTAQYGATWRVLRDGTVWIGTDGWPEVEPNGTVLDVHNGDGVVLSAPDTPDAVPGTSVRGHRILQVVHRLDSTGLRTEHHSTTVRSAFDKLLKPVRSEIDYSRKYPATVITQNADGTLQVMPDDAKIKANGLDRCEVFVGLPGTTLKVPHGARCLVAFSAGDPSRSHVEGWSQGTPFDSINIG
jgi:hypothetical protein